MSTGASASIYMCMWQKAHLQGPHSKPIHVPLDLGTLLSQCPSGFLDVRWAHKLAWQDADSMPLGLQERGIRSGTVPASLAVGLGSACDIAQRDMTTDTAHIRAMADRLYQGITSQCDGVVLNGPQSTDQRYVGNMNLSFSYVEGESLIMGLKVLAFAPCFASMPAYACGN